MTGTPGVGIDATEADVHPVRTFDERMSVGVEHERRVVRELRARGWSADEFGQGTFSTGVRSVLSGTDTPVRWLPDVIAAKRFAARSLVVFIDAKASTRHRETGMYAVECAALDAAERWLRFTGERSPFYYVFSDGRVATPELVRSTSVACAKRGNGSGTPYVLMPITACWSFAAIFGESTHDA